MLYYRSKELINYKDNKAALLNEGLMSAVEFQHLIEMVQKNHVSGVSGFGLAFYI